MSNSKNVSDFRRRRKANLIKAMGGKCCLCGYDKVQDALDFHHIDPSTKEYGIAEKGTCHNLDKDIAEIRKCVLVCANCHREIHANLYSIEELKNSQYIDEQFINELKENKGFTENHVRKGKVVYCSKCGKEISGDGYTGLCPECYGLEQRIVKTRPSRLELKEMIRTTPFTKIGEKYGITDNAIRKWCKAENLPFKRKDIDSYTESEWAKI